MRGPLKLTAGGDLPFSGADRAMVIAQREASATRSSRCLAVPLLLPLWLPALPAAARMAAAAANAAEMSLASPELPGWTAVSSGRSTCTEMGSHHLQWDVLLIISCHGPAYMVQ